MLLGLPALIHSYLLEPSPASLFSSLSPIRPPPSLYPVPTSLKSLPPFERNTTWTEPAKVRASTLSSMVSPFPDSFKTRIIDLSRRNIGIKLPWPVTGSMTDRSHKWTVLSPCQPSSLERPSVPFLGRVFVFFSDEIFFPCSIWPLGRSLWSKHCAHDTLTDHSNYSCPIIPFFFPCQVLLLSTPTSVFVPCRTLSFTMVSFWLCLHFL